MMRKQIGQITKTSIEGNYKNPSNFGYDTKKEHWITTDSSNSNMRKRFLSMVGNSGKITEPRKEVRGRDILNADKTKDLTDLDNLVIEKDPEKYRKKKSKKLKVKRATKKCRCK